MVYCHTPARWLHRPDQYFKGFSQAARTVGKAMGGLNHGLDNRRMCESDQILVNAKVIKNEVRNIYGVEAQVVHPVSSLEIPGPEKSPGIQPGFFLTPCRLLGYKRIDLVNAAARRLPDQQFVVAGEGPLSEQLRAESPSNVIYLGLVDDDVLRWLYRNCRAVLLTCAEDFGLVPAEAGAFGRASIVPNARGFRDKEDGHESIATYQFGDVDSMLTVLAAIDGESSGPVFDVARLKKDFRRQILDVVGDLVAVP